LIDLSEIVQGVIKDLNAKLEAARAIVHCQGLPALKGHPILLQILFNHILTNSIRFRHTIRPLVITISARELAADDIHHPAAIPDKPYLKVEIKDNGMGFDPADNEKVFEMFYQGHDKAKFKGSGMGLAIVRKIMDIHGGYVLADTVLGEGTCICCYFPI
jgi:signal transduction histidine kinase